MTAEEETAEFWMALPREAHDFSKINGLAKSLGRRPPFELQGALVGQPKPLTPIAAELYAHFASGGTMAEGVRLVEFLERGAQTVNRRSESTGRGSRLPADWQPSLAEVTFAAERGMAQARIATEAEKFRNYWTAKSGTGATKRDWSATWRNWIINAMERGYGPASDKGHRPGNNPTPRPAPTGSDAILAGMGRLARRIDERRASGSARGREVPQGAYSAAELDLGPGRTS